MSSLKETEESFENLETERRQALHAVMSFVAVLAILGGLFLVVWFLVISKPSAAKKTDEAKMARTVEVAIVEPAKGGASISAEGVVESQRVVTLTAEVTGKLVEVSPNLVAGGRVREGEILTAIESADYRAALEQTKAAKERALSAVADAELALQQEEARRDQALRDWQKLGKGKPSELLSRVPQIASAEARLASARADVESAKAEVERASRNLERTIIRAPFDAVVRQESVEVGAVLAPGTTLATLFSERSLEVELPLKLEDYALLRRDENGRVFGRVVFQGTLGTRTIQWPGEIVRTTGEVERGALTAGVVVAIEATDGEGELRLPPPGMFVRAELTGRSLEENLVVPREAVREGNRVAVVTPSNTIDYRDLQVVRSNATEVLVSEGVVAGERVILTRLAGAVQGMEVEVEEPKQPGEPKPREEQ
ncbi:efflux RND transporter periplasmic adaptor subunit [Roseibacillus persicicus]|uniref:efflux RND transporter periplasmic adaptor subunit n=1 Tax=Roseibacillus persicicus TaxID=454148 RepID=UPI00280F7BC2|nr:efflux RND transporter periplasmic adaptor subunit [Roseibacillus persicicus]MDQ8191193.1 efflux RND transporter periplasmic adaptor subunit [Roseibacillus persicicus]